MRLLLAATALVLAAPLCQAQDTSLDPTYGTLELAPGFAEDPTSVSLTSGGGTAVEVSGCNGMVADAPDVNLMWEGGSTLYIYATSDSDTTLLVNLPNGEWTCDDDTVGLNPVIIVRNAPAGMYNIWSGAIGDGAATTVMISEIDPR